MALFVLESVHLSSRNAIKVISDDELLKINFQIKETPSNNKESSTPQSNPQKNIIMLANQHVCVSFPLCTGAYTLYLFIRHAKCSQQFAAGADRDDSQFIMMILLKFNPKAQSREQREHFLLSRASVISTFWPEKCIIRVYTVRQITHEMRDTIYVNARRTLLFQPKSLLLFYDEWELLH